MGEGEAKNYYVLTLQGQLGPFDKQGVKDLAIAGGARGEDQVRNAFGRNLGTVRELIGPIRQTGSGRIAPERPANVSGRRPATASASGRPPSASDSGRAHIASSASGRPPATASGRAAARTSVRGTAPVAAPRRNSPVLWILLAGAILAVVGVAVLLLMRQGGDTAPPDAPSAPPPPVAAPPPSVPAAYVPLSRPAGAAEAQAAIGRVLAFAGYEGKEGIANAFDGSVDTKWYAPRRPIPAGDQRCGWVVIEPVTERRTVGSYALSSANDLFERDPKDWRLVGIDADGSERELDRRSGMQWTERKQRRHFPLAAVATYAAYRLDFLAQRGQDTDGLQLSEIELLPSQDDARTRSTSSSP